MRSSEPSILTATALGLALVGCGDLDPDAAAGSLRSKAAPTQATVPKAASSVLKAKPRGPSKKLQRQPLKRRPAPEVDPPEADDPEPVAPPLSPLREEGRLSGLTDAHNQLRAAVEITPLEWSESVAGFAQVWADYLATENNCKLAHRPQNGPFAQTYGENIFWKSGATNVAEVVGAWAAEASDYDHPTNSCSGICGHYTQIVWAATRYVGCGYAKCDGGGEMWVCNYDPRGNYYGQSPY